MPNQVSNLHIELLLLKQIIYPLEYITALFNFKLCTLPTTVVHSSFNRVSFGTVPCLLSNRLICLQGMEERCAAVQY